jgi:predicted amidophosphoribosyltransferase
MKNFNSIRAISEQFVIGIVYFCIAHLVNALFGIEPVCSFCTKKIHLYSHSQTIYCGGCQLEFMIHKKDNAMTIQFNLFSSIIERFFLIFPQALV